MSRLLPWLSAAAILFGLAAFQPLKAQHPTDWLGESTLIYAEVHRPSELVDTVYNHPVTQGVLALPQAQAGMNTKEFRDFKAGVTIAESQLDASWQEIVADLTGGGLVLALDGESQGVVVFAQASSAKRAQQLLDTVINLASADAKAKGNPSPIRTVEYRDIKVYGAGEAKVTLLGSWIVVTNNGDLGKSLVDRYLDGATDHLMSNAAFKQAYEARDKQSQAWARVDVATIRESGAAEDLYRSKTDNPLAELLIGGLLEITGKTDSAELTFDLTDSKVSLALASPWQEKWIGEAREYFWGFGGTGTAPAQLEVDNVILSLSAYRDAAEMWLRAGDLMEEEAVDGLAQADSVLSTLFLGKDFGEDILSAFEPTADIVVVRKAFEAGQAQPSIKLPGFAIVFDLKDPEEMQPQLKRIFQSLIGFVNVTGAMNGQPQLELDMFKEGDRQILTTKYLVDEDQEDPAALPIQYNFSPTVAFSGSRFVLSSDLPLAELLADAKRGKESGNSELVVNTAAQASLSELGKILADNREQLVAQNMLEEGNEREEAEAAIDALLSIVDLFESAQLHLEHDDDHVRFRIDINTKTK